MLLLFHFLIHAAVCPAGMLNLGVLDLDSVLPFLSKKPLLTTAVASVLDFCILSPMFDCHFMLRSEFMRDGAHLRHRLRLCSAACLLLCPIIMSFLVMNYFLKHLEHLYHHPSSIGTMTCAWPHCP